MNAEIVLLGPLEKITVPFVIIILMAGMGASLTWGNFKEALKSPKGILIGMFSQFGIMPLIAFGLAIFFKLPNSSMAALIFRRSKIKN